MLSNPVSLHSAIAENLANAGLITDARLFEAYVHVNGLANSLQAGAYQLRPSMTIPEIAQALQRAVAPEIVVRVGEGWRLEQTADYLTQKTPLDGADYRRRAETGDLAGLDATKYDFLALRPAGASLEASSTRTPTGCRRGTTAADLLGRQLDKFAEQVMPFWREAVAKGTTKLSLHEVLTLASIIQREAIADDERPMIAGVYLNRVAREDEAAGRSHGAIRDGFSTGHQTLVEDADEPRRVRQRRQPL